MEAVAAKVAWNPASPWLNKLTGDSVMPAGLKKRRTGAMRRKSLWSAKRLISSLLVISLLLVPGGTAAGASGQDIFENDRAPAEGPLFVPGEILIKFNPGVP